MSGLQNQNSKTKDGIATSCYYGGDSGTATPVTASPLRTSAVKTSRIGSSNPNEASLFVVSSDDDDDDGNGSNSTENRYDASTTKGSVLKKTEIMMMVCVLVSLFQGSLLISYIELGSKTKRNGSSFEKRAQIS